jgi:hypothetical protein
VKYLSLPDHHHFVPKISTKSQISCGEALPRHKKFGSLFYYASPKIIAGIITGMGAITICLSFAPDAIAQASVYKPTAISSGVEINDILTDKDIPTGQKGFARDYILETQKDDRLEITVTSGNFDTVLSLLDSKGDVIAENDDAVGDSTNSLIFVKIRQSGRYTVRVSSFGGSSGGKFTLKVNKLRIVN